MNQMNCWTMLLSAIRLLLTISDDVYQIQRLLANQTSNTDISAKEVNYQQNHML